MRFNSSGDVGIGPSTTNRLKVTYNPISGEAAFGPDSTSGSTALTLGTSSSGAYAERARITSSGAFLVGMTSLTSSVTNNGAYIKGDNVDSTNDYATIFIQHNSVTAHGLVIKETVSSTGQQIRFLHTAGTVVGSVTSTASATSYNTSSDYRLKTNVEPLTNALERLSELKVKRFNWIVNPEGPKVDGFIAHEVTPVVPEAVSGEKDALNKDGEIEPQGIDQSKLVPLLTAAIQELKQQLDIANARIAALENK